MRLLGNWGQRNLWYWYPNYFHIKVTLLQLQEYFVCWHCTVLYWYYEGYIVLAMHNRNKHTSIPITLINASAYSNFLDFCMVLLRYEGILITHTSENTCKIKCVLSVWDEDILDHTSWLKQAHFWHVLRNLWFKSWMEHWLSWLRFLTDFLSLFKQIPG
jgi:hypothetical protein